MGQAILTPDFYNELRTEQQLGYIVHSGLRYDTKALGLIFIVQSASHTPIEIEKYYDGWVGTVLSKLKKVSNFWKRLTSTSIQ